MIFAQALNATLRHLLETDERIVILGEDIADPYGGAFKVTRGLTTDFPDRVRTTPVSEAAILGISAGLALAGFRPITEIMFGDFSTLGFDQIVNHIAKYEAMYAGKAACPVIIRTPMGGHRGYGPTHSQSLEKHFVGVPHLRVVAASLYHEPRAVFAALLAHTAPVMYVEHKLLYPQHLSPNGDGALVGSHGADQRLPTISVSYVPREACSFTALAYGHQATWAREALKRLAIEEEIFGELLVPAQISPVDWDPILASVRTTGSLVTIEEGSSGWAWGTEAASVVGRELFDRLRHPVAVLASRATVIPSSREREKRVLVGPEQIEAAMRRAAA